MTHTFMAEGLFGTAYHRAILPSLNTGGAYLCRDSERNIMAGELGGGDTFFYHMPTRNWQVDEIIRIKSDGGRVIVDVDDYLPGVRESDDHVFAHKITDLSCDNITRATKEAGELSVSVPWLADKYGEHADHVWHTPNGIDMDRFVRHRHAPDRAPIIGWSGGTGHRKAVEAIIDSVWYVMRKVPEARLLILGEEPEFTIPDVMKDRYEFIQWTSREEYPKSLARINIMLAPDRPTDFYRGKSALRFYEAAACGTATIGGPTTYSEINHGVDGFVAECVDDWRDYLLVMASDFSQRKRMGDAAHARCKKDFSIMYRALNWDKAIHASPVQV